MASGRAFLATPALHHFSGGVAETFQCDVRLEARRTERPSVVGHEGGDGDTAVVSYTRFADRPAVVGRMTGHLEWDAGGGDVKGATSSAHLLRLSLLIRL